MSTAYYYVHGPVGVWVRIPPVGAGPFVSPTALLAGAVPTFLGHTLKDPRPSYEPKYKPVFSSQGGEAIPADKLYMGQDVKVALPLQRFDYDVVQALLATPRHGRVSPPGTETYLDIGTLKQRNGLAFEVWLVNEFAGTVNAAAYPNLPRGTYFPCCNVAGVYPENMGRDATLMQLVVEADWVQLWPAGSRVCYSQDEKYFAKIPAVPG